MPAASFGEVLMSDAAVSPTTAMAGGTMAGALVAILIRNLDALAKAQNAAMEGIGTLVQQQRDMLAAPLRGLTETPTSLMTADPRAAVARPFDTLKSALLDGTANASLL